tara:strand:- start:411 stop:641 length:231 start_codon:yes stop_codon:yes gene_type:complete
MTSLYSIMCPKCSEKVWCNNGDEEDMTVPDIEALKCPYCGHYWWLSDPSDMFHEEDLPEEYAEDGYKTPNEAAGYG